MKKKIMFFFSYVLSESKQTDGFLTHLLTYYHNTNKKKKKVAVITGVHHRAQFTMFNHSSVDGHQA
jgi:hypothetical protein